MTTAGNITEKAKPSAGNAIPPRPPGSAANTAAATIARPDARLMITSGATRSPAKASRNRPTVSPPQYEATSALAANASTARVSPI